MFLLFIPNVFLTKYSSFFVMCNMFCMSLDILEIIVLLNNVDFGLPVFVDRYQCVFDYE